MRYLAELQGERVHQEEREEKQREATAGSGQESSEGGRYHINHSPVWQQRYKYFK